MPQEWLSVTQSQENGPDGPRWGARPPGCQMSGPCARRLSRGTQTAGQRREQRSLAQWPGLRGTHPGVQLEASTSPPLAPARPAHLEHLVDAGVALRRLSFPWLPLGALKDKRHLSCRGQPGPDHSCCPLSVTWTRGQHRLRLAAHRWVQSSKRGAYEGTRALSAGAWELGLVSAELDRPGED